MKCSFIKRDGSASLVLFFAGWGMDLNPFKDIDSSCDIAIIWDYEDFELPASQFYDYQNIYLFAWSFGIFAASEYIQSHPCLPIVLKTAINGTQFPIDNQRGIPTNIFNATCDNLSEHSLLKFYRRICANSEEYLSFLAHKPARSIQSLHDELANIRDTSLSSTRQPMVWDNVIASRRDLIFPFENQLNGWEGLCSNMEIEDNGAHMPHDFESIINKNIINKQLVKKRFSSSFDSGYDDNAFIQRKIAQSLYRKWKASIGINPEASILEIGCGTGFLTRLYSAEAYPSRLVLNDICNIPTVTLNLNITKYEFIENDAEKLSFPENSFDYVVSSSAIQWFENLPQFFNKLHQWLRPGGAMVISTFGTENMKEIKEHVKISLNYKSLNWLDNEIKRNFDIVLINEESEIMLFDSPLQVLKHIQSTGVNSIGSKSASSGTLRRLIRNYQPVNGKFQLTYNPIYIIATNK